jgi:hypothetical protein
MDWLLAGDVNAEPYYEDGVERRRYSRELYEQIKGSEWESVRPEETPSELHIGALATTTNWLPILAAAEKSGKSVIAVYHMRKFLDEMREKFGFDEETASQI